MTIPRTLRNPEELRRLSWLYSGMALVGPVDEYVCLARSARVGVTVNLT
ncbi:hypothetical protein [Mycobacterium sp.]|nr:hypothetical protein [Mycobacterium sp.]